MLMESRCIFCRTLEKWRYDTQTPKVGVRVSPYAYHTPIFSPLDIFSREKTAWKYRKELIFILIETLITVGLQIRPSQLNNAKFDKRMLSMQTFDLENVNRFSHIILMLLLSDFRIINLEPRITVCCNNCQKEANCNTLRPICTCKISLNAFGFGGV